MEKENRKKIGLALGSGGVRGLAHIGVIKVLQKNKIPIDFISGSSVGSLIGSYLSVFGEVESLEKSILENSKELLPLLFDFSLKGGLVKGRKIDDSFKRIFKDADFSKTKIPFFVIATDLISGQPVVYSSGKLSPAVHGSMAVPLVFKPFHYKEKLLVDGGLSDPVPVETLKKAGADSVIAVNLYHKNEFRNKKFTFSGVALRSVRIALHNLSKISVRNADIILNPDTSNFLNKLKMKDYLNKEKIKEIISIGEEEARRNLPEIKKITMV
ncbi:MAG TPA: patatin-like phospholipase family protein [Candidatus Paceibacterota bacterium]|nr:patatin-like phospholipase family protein [Candidatus Paceibacterota bacterium]HPT18400.1 patatin-like phospholipase family protein [Candidatus Paceibacterota bacterium]